MSQPPLSRQIQELEEELGFALFTREYHKVTLTGAGRTYPAHARLILDQVARARQEAAGIALGGTGLLRVGHGTHLPDATSPLTQLSQLAGENFVSCRKYEDPGYREIVEAICLREGFMPRVLQAVEHKSTVLDLVANGLGITFIQRSAATERPDGIRYVQFPGCIPHVDSAIAWRADARHESIAPFAEAAEQEATLLSAQVPAVSDAAVSCNAGYAVNV